MSPATHIEIIEATGPEHIEAVSSLFDAYRVFYDQPSDPAGARRFMGERLGNRDSVVYLARSRGRDGIAMPLGFVQLYPTFSSVSMKRLWILNDLFVVREERSRGVGRALIDKALSLAKATNAKGVILETAIDNSTARALYESCGFVEDIEFLRYARYF